MIRHRLYRRGRWWWVDYTWQDARHRHPLRTSSKRDAEELAAIHLRDMVRSTAPVVTLGALTVEFLNMGRVEKRSWRSDRSLAKVILEHFGAGQPVDKIKPGDVQAFKTMLSQRQGARGLISHATVNRHLALLKSIINKAIELERFNGRNPCTKIKFYQESPSLEYFTAAEVRRLLESAVRVSASANTEIQRYFVHILAVAIMTGMRLSEILCLRWADIRDNMITVRAENSKSKRSRQIPAAPGLLQAMTRLPSIGGEFVFPVRHDAGVIRPTWKRVKRMAGVKPGARFHNLRHSFGSLLVQGGVDLATVRELLGHSSLAMTQVYAHSSQAAKVAAIQGLDFVPQTTPNSVQGGVSQKALKR